MPRLQKRAKQKLQLPHLAIYNLSESLELDDNVTLFTINRCSIWCPVLWSDKSTNPCWECSAIQKN